ncbi:MAG: patatin-like phospholipase family protein [Acidimicrobiales bacterium]
MSGRVGLVLGAGGVAGGAFHAGVLAAMQEATGWDPRAAAVMVGTSAGSVAVTSLRAGLSAPDLLARAEDRLLSPEGAALMRRVGAPRRPPLRQNAPPRAATDVASTLARAARRPFQSRPWAVLAGLIPEGTVSTHFISDGIGALFSSEWPAEPLWICAVRQSDGRRVVFGRGGKRPSLAAAVAASCAIPGFFQPVEIDGDTYIDGGVHSPTNADVLAREPLELIVISSPMSISGRHLRLTADQPMRRFSQAMLDAEAIRLRRRGHTVLAFQPTPADAAVMGLNAMDPERRGAIARQVRETTLRRLERPETRSRLGPLAS